MSDDNIPNWDLSACYSSLECAELKADILAAEYGFKEIEAQIKRKDKKCEENIPELLKRFDDIALLFSTPATFIELRAMIEPASPELSILLNRIGELKLIQNRLWTLLMDMLLTATESDAYALSQQAISPYTYSIQEHCRLTPHRMSSDDKRIISSMQKNGGQAWYRLRNQLDMNAAAPLREREEPLPLAQLRGLASSPDAELRRLAYQAELQLYPTYEGPMAACLNAIKGEAIEELIYKNYPSVEDEMADINRINMRTLECMFCSIEEHIPCFRRYLRKKAELFGHQNGLPWYDLLAPMPGSPVDISFSAAGQMLSEALHSFSDELGELTDQALGKHWIDAMPSAGKQSGAICVDLPAKKEVRILTNYSGSFHCIRTIAHELGHAYHARCLDGIPLMLRDAPTPICETAAIMNEIIFLNKTLEMFPAKQQFALLESDLQEATQTILDIYSRYLFEKDLFARRKDAVLAPSELCSLMKAAQQRVYGDALDTEYLHPYIWMCKVHFYIPEFHYYNYPYIFGLLFAKGLYAQYLENPHAFPAAYQQLLQATCTSGMEEIAKLAGVDICDKAFWDKALDMFADEIEQWISLSDEYKTDVS